MEYTTGEWYREGSFSIHVKSECYNVLVATVEDYDINSTEKESNANLIAAAPDMYEALKRALQDLNESVQRCNMEKSCARTIHLSEQALSKAEGK